MSVFDQSFSGFSPGCCKEPSTPFSGSSFGHLDDTKQLLTGEDEQKKQEIDTLLSEAFNNLTFEERQVQQEELHGVADKLAEEASLIENSLSDLEFHLSQIKAGSFYETAELMNPGYVHASNFQMSFLRAERYNTRAAADRMLRFFDEKHKLFGMEKLTQDITIDDLDEDDIATLKTGCIQWAGKDRSDRPICLHVAGLRKFKELKNELRTRYFIMMAAVKSPEAQLRGIVILNYAVGHFKDRTNGHGWQEHSRLAEAIPIYPGAYHFACDDLKEYLFMNVTISLMPAGLRARFRLHLGTHVECQYVLSSYGIRTSLLPISPESNSIDLQAHLQWCQKYISNSCHAKNQPAAATVPSASTRAIAEPNPNDVLAGGSTKIDNVGNGRLRLLVKISAETYRIGSYEEKRQIVDRIIGDIHGAGGRFLQKEKGSEASWKELSLSKARVKITQQFRNQNRRRESVSQQAREGTPIAGTPLPNDVIFGRSHRNSGTALLHQLIKNRSEEYEALDRRMKFVVVDAIIDEIKSGGGRFLQQSASDNGGYVELSNDATRERISTYFRNCRRPSKNTAMAASP